VFDGEFCLLLELADRSCRIPNLAPVIKIDPTGPQITANWIAESGNQRTLLLGGGIGKLFKVGKQPVNASLQAYGNVIRPENGPVWVLRFQVQLLFPTDG
jgi:hypothetical protein